MLIMMMMMIQIWQHMFRKRDLQTLGLPIHRLALADMANGNSTRELFSGN